MELAFDAMIGKTNEEIALRMKTLYHDGNGFELDGRRFSVERVLDVRRAAATKAGGQGMR